MMSQTSSTEIHNLQRSDTSQQVSIIEPPRPVTTDSEQVGLYTDHCSLPTARRTLANRRNALRSTGPRTPRGKATVGRNTLKHGVFASKALVLHGAGKESRSRFRRLLKSLQADFCPQGAMEELLVEQIAVCYWRLRRIYDCESSVISGQLAGSESQIILQRQARVRAARDYLTLSKNRLDHNMLAFRGSPREDTEKIAGALEQAHQQLLTTSEGLDFLLGLLDSMDDYVRNHDCLDHLWIQQCGADLYFYFPAAETAIRDIGIPLCHIEQLQPVNPARETEIKQHREDFLEGVRKARALLLARRRVVEQNENAELQTARAGMKLPLLKDARRIWRFQWYIDRQLGRALDQLERLQRRRAGEFVPPPVRAEISLKRES